MNMACSKSSRAHLDLVTHVTPKFQCQNNNVRAATQTTNTSFSVAVAEHSFSSIPSNSIFYGFIDKKACKFTCILQLVCAVTWAGVEFMTNILHEVKWYQQGYWAGGSVTIINIVSFGLLGFIHGGKPCRATANAFVFIFIFSVFSWMISIAAFIFGCIEMQWTFHLDRVDHARICMTFVDCFLSYSLVAFTLLQVLLTYRSYTETFRRQALKMSF